MPNPTADQWLQIIEIGVTLLGVIITTYFAWAVQRAERSAAEREDEHRKPQLNFIVNKSRWMLINVGGSTATTIRFCDEGGAGKVRPRMGYSLPQNWIINVNPFIKHAAALSAAYQDVSGRRYLVVCRGDTNTVWEEGENGFDENLFTFLHTNPERTDDISIQQVP